MAVPHHCHSLLLTAPRQLTWILEGLPPIQPHEVLIQTQAGAISMGTELPHYIGNSRHSHQRPYPYMTGYESVGTVIACGSQVRKRRVGDRVVAFYGHRTYAIVPEKKTIFVPEHITDEIALLSILTCDVSKGIQKVAPQADEPTLVTGAGTIGLCSLFMLKAMGIQRVDIIEPQESRQPLAHQFGADSAASPAHVQEHGFSRYVVGLECSSRNIAFELLQARMASNGRLSILADGNIEPLVLTSAFHEKELRIVGSSDGLDYQAHARWFFDQNREKLRTLATLFDCQITADKLISTFDGLANQTITATKVLVRYTRESDSEYSSCREKDL